MKKHSTCDGRSRPRLVVFVDGVHAHVPPRRVRRVRRALRAIGIGSTLERPRAGAGHLVCFTLAGVEGLFLSFVVDVLTENRARLVRIELAADPVDVNPDHAESLALETLRLKHGRVQRPERAAGHRVSYVGSRRDPLALAIYADRPCKRTSERTKRTCHVELRIQTRVDPEELRKLDPATNEGRSLILETLERETTWKHFVECLSVAHITARASARVVVCG